ncbi:hypothetical protein C8Q79DRAFT_360368 [Trametes meyenii]|nr:hypothetical protein C8Q79DRAFT_360368 [Trametes meyenii]
MSSSRHIGTLIVVILKARNLPNKRHIGKQDPYCQVIFNGERRRTKAIKRGGQHPEWDEEIRFELFEDTDDIPHIPELSDGPPPPPPPKSASKGPPKVKGGKFMSVACFAEDPREPDLIGETKVDLTEVLTKGETDEWFTVMNKDKYCGEVYLELTFWLDEPPPTKKVNPKPNGQYGGRGTFVPAGDSASSSLSDANSYSVSSRLSASSTREEIRRENLPPSLRSSSSRLDIYVAPYESTRSHNSSVDGIVNDFAELRVEPGVNRRQSMPAQTSSYLPRPASSLGLPEPSGYSSNSLPTHHHAGFSDGGSNYQYDYNSGPPQSHNQDSAPLPDPYQPAYEQTPAPTGYQPPHHGRPRYSLPPTSSGFVPLPTPAPSGFTPLSSHLPQPSGFLPPPATPAPYGAVVVPTRVPSSSFSTLSTLPSFQQATPASSFPPSVTSSPSLYYPPHNPPPSTSYPQSGQHTPPTYPQHGSSLPPSSSFPHNTPPPSSSYQNTPPPSSYQNMPTSSFPQNIPAHSYSQIPPPPSSSTPPQSQQPQFSHSISSPSIPSHTQSAPPEQQPYSNHTTSSPSRDNIPPPPPLTDSPSKGPTTGSRPLPQPQAQSQQSRRQSSLPIPPPSSQGYYNGTQNPPAFPSAYQSIPPPPPLPQQPTGQPQSSFPQNGHQLAPPGPPPPLPPSQFAQGQTPTPPKRRPSLPPPPVGYQPQLSAFQSLPPPPPPPSLPSHLQYEPISSFSPSSQPGQAYYPGPPPRPPQYLPPVGPPPGHGGYSPPIPQGQEYDPYGR